MVVTSEGKWRVDKGDVMIMRAEENEENSRLID